MQISQDVCLALAVFCGAVTAPPDWPAARRRICRPLTTDDEPRAPRKPAAWIAPTLAALGTGCRPCELARRSGTCKRTTEDHLVRLLAAGLIRRDGRIYRPR